MSDFKNYNLGSIEPYSFANIDLSRQAMEWVGLEVTSNLLHTKHRTHPTGRTKEDWMAAQSAAQKAFFDLHDMDRLEIITLRLAEELESGTKYEVGCLERMLAEHGGI